MKYSNNNKIPEDFEKKKLESSYGIHLTSLIAQLVKNLPTVWESCVQSLGWGDPLEKKKATRYSILAWRIPWTV